MLGVLLTRTLIMCFGYAYPAFECYKIVEKNRVEIEDLRFWCQYWIIVAFLTVMERLGDVFISWLPMYGEAKVALFIYLWYPKTRGTGYIYKTLLRPYVSKHESDIDNKLLELRARAWDMTIFYWQNFAQYGQAAFFQFLQYMAMAAQTAKATKTTTTTEEVVQETVNGESKTPQRTPSGKPKWPPETNGTTTTTTKVVEQVEETDKPRLRRFKATN